MTQISSRDMEIVDRAISNYFNSSEDAVVRARLGDIGYRSLSVGLDAKRTTEHIEAARMILPYIQAPATEVLGALAEVYSEATKLGVRSALKESAKAGYEGHSPSYRLQSLVNRGAQNGRRKISLEVFTDLATTAIVDPAPRREAYRMPKDHPISNGRKISIKIKSH